MRTMRGLAKATQCPVEFPPGDSAAKEIDTAAGQYLSPENLAIIVVGDRKQIDEQLKTLNLPIEYLSAEEL